MKLAISTVIIVAFLSGLVVAQVLLPPIYIYVSVKEAITIDPESMHISLCVGETKTADFTIHNIANVAIPLELVATVTVYPEGATASDVTLDYPTTLSAPNGDTILTVTVTLATGAVIGNYEITLSPTRV